MKGLKSGEAFIISLLGALTGGAFLLAVRERLLVARFPASNFIQPEKVAHIAEKFPFDERAFIYHAWDFVYRNIRYRPFGTAIRFYDSTAVCHRCLFPEEVLRRGEANCVGMASLLVSLLRNRIEPERVLMVMGDLRKNGVGGHSWCEINLGDWYILEPTSPPGRLYKAEALKEIYRPEVYLNDVYFSCISPELCVKIG